ncbi:MAG: isoleucyl-tRNA synthetase [Patescibacteria group bacterium]|nr:isoleucyl-tRNA synthetase [Patescibacteria group bacterium]
MFKPVSPQPQFAELEEEVLSFWQKNQIFEKSVSQNEGKDLYVIYDGPPTANAKPPLHTMVPMSFKDLVGRYKTMQGFHVPRQAGWDTHGLPVEVQIEKKLGLSGKKEILNLVPGDQRASIAQFNDACRTSVWEFKQEWDKFVPRVGYWTDTQNPYITYEPQYIEKVWGVFKQIWDKDLVYKGYRVSPYCPRCGTGLSAAEVASEYQDVKDVSVFASFPIKGQENRSLLAWTTTPWTLPGNVALAVGSDIDYVVVKQEEKEYVLAKSRLEILKGEYVIVQEMKGSELVGLEYEPLYDSLVDASEKKHYVLAADFVTTNDGSGIVHTAVMYGEDDFNLGKAAGLPTVHTVGLDGHFLENVKEFAGMYVRDALVPILKDLTEKGRLYAKQTITHSYPFCWRCKTALIYYAKDSWYISMSKLRSELVENNQTVSWFPEHIKEGRFGDFVREARDWAVSRERFWGTPLPVWTSQSGKVLCVGSFEELKQLAKDPSVIGSGFDPHRPYVDDVILVKDGEEYVHEPLVLDVWFDSGSMPYASGRAKQGHFPADYIAEAVDQTRGWFYTLQAIGTIIKDESPYRRVTCMGHIVDETGKKMSKSLGNVFDPWEMFSFLGVDVIRWFLYTVNSPGETKSLSKKELQTTLRKSLLLLWNVFNYFVTYANVSGFEAPTEDQRKRLRSELVVEGGELTVLDRWMLSRQASVSESVTGYMEAYDFMRAGRALEAYIDDISTWYLRRSRKRDDKAFFTVMHDVLTNLAAMMAPFTPFVTENIYQVLKTEDMAESVHLSTWPGSLAGKDEAVENAMLTLREAVELGLSIRSAEKLKVRQPLAEAYVRTDEVLSDELLSILSDELNVEKSILTKGEEGFPTKATESLQVWLNTELTDELIQAGLARDLLRNIQQLRKQKGLQPGQRVLLQVNATHRADIEPLLAQFAFISEDAFLDISEESWKEGGEHEISFNGQTIQIDLIS